MKKNGLPRLVVLAVILGVSGLAVLGYNAFRKDVLAMQAASQEDITWTSFQLEQELGRFRDALNQFQIDGTGVDASTVNTRFDILWSRIAVFQQGRVGERLAQYDRETLIVPRLFSQMKSVDRRIVNLQDSDKADAALLVLEFAPYADELREFSRFVTLGEETRGREIREQLQAGVNRTLLLGGLAIAIALFSLAYINRESMRFRRLASANRKLADVAEKASRAKSQFLTMMSHELRTPMNGVLGLLALSKQGAVQKNQLHLIEQAEQSGRQMVGLLADILDFSALHSDELHLENKPFELTHLAHAVREQFTPLAKREGISFDVSVNQNCPPRYQGDFRRLRQAFSHLAQYVVETAGVRDAEMEFSCNNSALVVKLSFDYLSHGGEWTPDLILGGDRRDDRAFASDALGPAIARGFIEAMNGTLLVDNPVGERIQVIARIPIEEFVVTALSVAVITSSEAMAAICRAALSTSDIDFLQKDDPTEAHIVLVEAGNITEGNFLVRARKNHPNALIVGLGTPINPDAFDFSVKLPLDFHELREIVALRTA